jgi:hypothetical protein
LLPASCYLLKLPANCYLHDVAAGQEAGSR